MKRTTVAIAIVVLAATPAMFGQNPPVTAPPAGVPAASAAGQRAGRGGGGRQPMQTMTLSTPAWTDGGQIPVKYSQAGEEVSPPLSWSGTPAGAVSFALVAHDMDSGAGPADDLLQWMVWNIPAASAGLGEAVSQGPQLPDGSRQISVTGPYYRGPAAPASGPPHHYVFEIFALDTMIDVPAVGAAPAATRAAVVAAMAGHVRGKGVLIGIFRRAS